MKDFRALSVWRKAHDLTLAMYRITAWYPFEERFGLTGQTRRSAVSITSNIAEGCGRGSDPDPDLARFLQIAFGSASELDYQILLGHDLGFMNSAEHDALQSSLAEVKRMLASLIQRVRPS
jgi:four helix bundle protein